MTVSVAASEAEILEKLIVRRAGGFSSEAAGAMLNLAFDRPTSNRIRQLLRKNNRGAISVEERLTLEKHMRVGQLIDLLQAAARLSLKQSASSSR